MFIQVQFMLVNSKSMEMSFMIQIQYSSLFHKRIVLGASYRFMITLNRIHQDNQMALNKENKYK
jgi:hypothetical protein